MKLASLISFDLIKNVAVAYILYSALSWLFGWHAKKESVSVEMNSKKKATKTRDEPITTAAAYLRSQLTCPPSTLGGAERFSSLPYPSPINEKTKEILMVTHGFTDNDVSRISAKLRSKGKGKKDSTATIVISQTHLRSADCIKLLCVLSCIYSLVVMVQLPLLIDDDAEKEKEKGNASSNNKELESVYTRPDMVRLINANLLPKHRIVSFTTEKGKIAIVRQLRPELYIDHNANSCSTLLSHVRVILHIDGSIGKHDGSDGSEGGGVVYSYEAGSAKTASPKISPMASYQAILTLELRR